MPLISTHRTQWRPANGLLYLRDVDADAGVGTSEAITAADRDVAASTGYEIVILRWQGLLLVGIELQAWDGTPDENPSGDGWTGPLTFPLECPSRRLFLSDTSDVALSGIAAPAGPADWRKWNGSARPINGIENTNGGTALSAFYRTNRMLDCDAFYVKVVG